MMRRLILWAMVSMALVSCVSSQEYKKLESKYDKLNRDSEWADVDHFRFLEYLAKDLGISYQVISDAYEEYEIKNPVPDTVNYIRTYK